MVDTPSTAENYEKMAKAALAAASGKPQAKNKYCPDDFDSQESFLEYLVKTFNDDVTADFFNIQAFLEDAAFVGGMQWDPIIQNQRILDQKPCLTVNSAPALVGQVMGNRLLNETSIRVLPDQGGTKPIADTRQGLIRSIEKISNGDRAYDVAMQNQVIGGIGNFGVRTKYADNDVFDQEIEIYPIANPGAVVWDRLRTDPTGRDAGHVFEYDLMLRSEFAETWPWAQPAEFGSTLAYTQMLQTNGWVTVDMVRVVNFWRMRQIKRTIAMKKDGSVVDVTDKPPAEWVSDLAQHPQTGLPIMRETVRTYAELTKCSAVNVLEGPFRYWIDRVPVFRVPGWEINVGDTWQRFGLIRFAKDPMRFRNFWRSVQAEKLMQTPKATWLASQEAVAGHEDRYRNSNISNDPLLMYNGESGAKPERIAPAQIETSLMQAAGQNEQDIRNVTNLHEASLGQESNEVSGKAINARVRVGELGTVIYQHNLNAAIGEAGRVINDLIPYIYDTPREIKVLGDDGKSEVVPINNPDDPDSIDITVGKYQVSVVTGPSYTTRRVEAVQTLETIINAHPEVFSWAGDLLFKNMDIPGATELQERAEKMLPPNLRDQDDMSPEEQQQAAQAAQASQLAAKQQSDMVEAKIALERAKVDDMAEAVKEKQARQKLFEAQASEVMARIAKMQAETQLIDAKIPLTDAQTQHTISQTHAEDVGAAVDIEGAKVQTVFKEG